MAVDAGRVPAARALLAQLGVSVEDLLAVPAELPVLLLRLHTETACRRGGALGLRLMDLDVIQGLVRLREKGETTRLERGQRDRDGGGAAHDAGAASKQEQKR